MKVRHILLLLALLGVAFAAQQFTLYLRSVEELAPLKAQSAHYVGLIEKAMYDESQIRQQLKESEQRYQQLRLRLPAELAEENFAQQLRQLAAAQQLKVLSSSSAVQSRPFYREATLRITLEGEATAIRRLMRQITSLPRLVRVEERGNRGNKLHHLTITLYAAEHEVPRQFAPPDCIEMPGGLLLPPLTDWLREQHAAYLRQCHFVNNYNQLYRELLRLRALKEEVQRLETIAAELEKGA